MATQTVFRLVSRTDLEGIQAFTEPIPLPDKYEVLVKIRSVSLNGREVAIAHSTYPLPINDRVVPCSDMAGEVVRVGALVNGFTVGDLVTAPLNPSLQYGQLQHPNDSFGGTRDGMLREYIALPECALIKLPGSPLGMNDWAALVQSGSTAWNALYGNKALRPGDTVLCQGTGGVSLVGLVLAKAAGAIAIVTSSSNEKLNIVREKYGADHCINYKTHPNWGDEVQRITGGRGADHILEIGGEGTMAQSLNAVARGGVISIIGFITKVSQDEMPNVTMMSLLKGCVVRGVQGGSKQQLEEAVRFVAAKNLHMPVEKTYKFNRQEVIAGLRSIEAGEHVGKICIEVA